jgi:ankyrin repeat protein
MEDLVIAARDGDLATIRRLHAEGVDLTQRGRFGTTAIMLAAEHDHARTVKYLQSAGARITEKYDDGFSALHLAAHRGRLALLKHFLQEDGGRISNAPDEFETIWQLLRLQVADPVALTSLLKIMVMLDDDPSAFVANLSQAHAELTTRGRLFHAQLLPYLEWQRASVVEHCPLPAVLNYIVADFAATTPENMWVHGLRTQAS